MTDPQTDFADPEAAAVDEGMVGPGVPVIDSGETAPSAAGTPEEITRPPSKRVST